MPGRKKHKEVVRLTLVEQRALVLLRRALDEVARPAGIQDMTAYSESDHYEWRHWAKVSGRPPQAANQPSEAWAIFREDLPSDVILKMQANFYAGASWTEISLLPIAIHFLNVWSWRLDKPDAALLFDINNLTEYKEKVEALTSRQLRHFILLLPVMLIDQWDDPFNLSIEGFIEQELRPNLRKYWRAVGIPPNIKLFPEVLNEMAENAARRETFKKRWIGKTHGGFRENKSGFAHREDFTNIIEFINRAHPLWKQIVRFFALNDYDENCVEMVQTTEKYKKLSAGTTVPDGLLKRVFKKKSESGPHLEPLGLAIEHARVEFNFKESGTTVRRYYRARAASN